MKVLLTVLAIPAGFLCVLLWNYINAFTLGIYALSAAKNAKTDSLEMAVESFLENDAKAMRTMSWLNPSAVVTIIAFIWEQETLAFILLALFLFAAFYFAATSYQKAYYQNHLDYKYGVPVEQSEMLARSTNR